MEVQTVLIPKKKFTLKEAEKKILDMGYKKKYYGKGVDETENFYRFRQETPLNFEKDSYFTKTISDDIMLVFGKIKNK